MLQNDTKFLITAKFKVFTIPPITDGLVIGKAAPIGINALQKALKLLIPDEFCTIDLSDDIVGCIILKASLIRRLSEDRIISFLLQHVKPFMDEEDIFHVQLEAEITVTQEI